MLQNVPFRNALAANTLRSRLRQGTKKGAGWLRSRPTPDITQLKYGVCLYVRS